MLDRLATRKMETIMKKTDIPIFLRGVFWTLFMGMAAWIAVDMNKIVAHYKQAEYMRLNVEQVMGEE
jgi:hypothetical protein